MRSYYVDTDDTIDVETLTDRLYQFDNEIEWALSDSDPVDDLVREKNLLTEILAELCGNGGDHRWDGNWYPSQLILDSHFTDYARELLDDCGVIPKDLPAYVEIDWEATVKNIQGDYTSIELEGVTYWFR